MNFKTLKLRFLVWLLGNGAEYTLTGKCQIPAPKGGLGSIVLEPFWVDRNRVARQTVLRWNGAPNHSMRPNNRSARIIIKAFHAVAGALPPEYAQLPPMELVQRLHDEGRIAAVREDAKRRGISLYDARAKEQIDLVLRALRQDGKEINFEDNNFATNLAAAFAKISHVETRH